MRIGSILHGLGTGARAVLLGAVALGCATTSGKDERQVELHRAKVHYDVGVERMAQGRTALALRELKRAQELDPSDAWIPLALAEGYRRKGRLEQAEQHLMRALELRPDFQSARLNLAALYVQLKRYEDAIPHASALTEDPTFPAPWRALTNLGWAQLQLGRRKEARRHLELAVEYHDGYWPALLDLGILEAEEGNRLAALQLFERVLEREPGPLAEAEVHFRMAEIFVSLGQRDRAIQHLTAVRERRPSGTWGKRSADYLKLLR